MNQAQKKLLKDRLNRVDIDNYSRRRRREKKIYGHEPQRIKNIRRRVRKLEREIRKFREQRERVATRAKAPYYKAVRAAMEEINFGTDAQKALALVVKVEKLARIHG